MQQLVRQLPIGDIAGNGRDAKAPLHFREARRVARDGGNLRLACDERLDDAETESAAAAGDDDALINQSFHESLQNRAMGGSKLENDRGT
jgi:hypothetical protein